MNLKAIFLLSLSFFLLTIKPAFADEPIISEFMALNSHGIQERNQDMV